MYQGTNITAIQSQQWLCSSMLELMERKGYHSITIAMLCSHAGLSRQTFYNVFDSKEEVLRYCIRNQYESQFRRYADQINMTIEESVAVFVCVVENCYRLQSMMIKNNLEGIVLDEISRCITLFSDHFVKQEQKDSRFAYIQALLSGAMGNLLVYWMKQEAPIPMEELTQLAREFLMGPLFAVSPAK